MERDHSTWERRRRRKKKRRERMRRRRSKRRRRWQRKRRGGQSVSILLPNDSPVVTFRSVNSPGPPSRLNAATPTLQ